MSKLERYIMPTLQTCNYYNSHSFPLFLHIPNTREIREQLHHKNNLIVASQIIR
jgi:hypothetical protein